MSEFLILTDSSADLSNEMVRALGIEVLPLRFTIGGKTYANYPDNREMDLRVFYQRLADGETSTTSAVNVHDYVDFLTPVLESGRDVLILAFSSGLSTTCNSAQVAAGELSERYPERKIFVVDTLCASVSQGLLVYLAAQERRKGRTIDEVRDWAEENKLHVCGYFTVNDLHFLKRGGRISATTAVVGSMLQIKPILYVNNEGKLVSIGKARGRQASLKAMADGMAKNAVDPAHSPVFISHGDCLEDARALGQMVRERFGTTEIYYNYVGPVIGSHTGPGVVTLFYMGTER